MKGRLLVGQSGGATAVINSSLVGVIQEAAKHNDITDLLGMRHGIEGLLKDDIVDLGGMSQESLERLKHTPSAALGSCRYKASAEDIDRVLEILIGYDIRYFFYIGGNDSADTSHRIAMLAREKRYGLRVVAVPKTIDNDLPITDHSPGYGSIARFVAVSTMDSGKDTEASSNLYPVKIIEVMGRNAGWVAASSALGKNTDEDAPHLIYVPERAFVQEAFLEDVQKHYQKRGYVVIVITETLQDADGQPLGATEPWFIDSFGHRYFEGPAAHLSHLVTEELGLRARFDKPGTIQRMSMSCVSKVDLEEAYRVGSSAVKYAMEGLSDVMVTLNRQASPVYHCSPGIAPLEQIANTEKKLPLDFLNKEGNFVTESFLTYAHPLLGDPLPDYYRIKGNRFRLSLNPRQEPIKEVVE